VRVNEFKTKIDVARCWTCSRSASACPGSSSTPVLSEKLVTDNVVSRLKSNRAQGRPGHPRGGTPPGGIPPGVYFISLTLTGRVITVKLLVWEHKRDSSGTHARRYLYTTDLSLSEEIEEAWRMRWVHHQQCRQGAGGGAEPEERGDVPQALERPLGGPPGLMKIFKLR